MTSALDSPISLAVINCAAAPVDRPLVRLLIYNGHAEGIGQHYQRVILSKRSRKASFGLPYQDRTFSWPQSRTIARTQFLGRQSFTRRRWRRLGALIAFAGLGIALGATWLLIFLPVSAVALRKLAIEREEAYLTHRFGDAYRAYLARVRRWI
jgi:hypothetical protein